MLAGGSERERERKKTAFKLMEIPYSSAGILYTLRSASNFASTPKKHQYYPHTPSYLVLFSTSVLSIAVLRCYFFIIVIYSLHHLPRFYTHKVSQLSVIYPISQLVAEKCEGGGGGTRAHLSNWEISQIRHQTTSRGTPRVSFF